MRCRVQNVTRLPNGTISTKDREITTSGNRVRIGRGTDNDIVLKDLSVAFRHADIIVRDFDIVVEAIGGSPLRFDDVPAGRGVLASDTVVGIGPYQIRLLPPEQGFDLAIAVESGEAATAAAPPVAAAPLRLRGGLLARRPLSWLLFATVLVGCLVLPVMAHLFYERDRAPVLADGRTGGDRPATMLAGFDHAWDSGELSDSHKFLEQRCEACHVVPFQPVRNEDCGACHGSVRHHFADRDGTITAALAAGGLDSARCTACHAEHQGPDGAVPNQQALCVGCHADLKQYAANTALGKVTDFGDGHPQFKPSVIVDAAGTVQRLELGGQVPPKESSGLRFDHACHMGGEHVQTAKEGEPGWLCAKQDGLLRARSMPPEAAAEPPGPGETVRVDLDGVLAADFQLSGNALTAKLGCASCHQPDAGGALMRPIDMESHCSYCHALEFDPEKPERVLPHGKPEEVVDVLTYFYGAQAVRPPLLRTDPTTKLRRRPGAKAEPAAAPAPAPAPAAEQAGGTPAPNALFAKRLERVFADDGASTCGYCHRTTSVAGEKGTEYDVLPVRVQGIWQPLARFDHAAHTNLPCGHCHEAAASIESSDVLMPPIANCRECHQGEFAHAAVPSTCTMCHVYHQEKGTCPIVPNAGLVGGTPLDCPAASTTAASVADD